MITQFSCSGFRNVKCSKLEFGRINILIGPNNAGKSNFIKAVSFIANMLNNPITDSTGFLSELKRNGWNSLINRENDTSVFKLDWSFDIEKQKPKVHYSLNANIGPKREDDFICKESLESVLPTNKQYEKPYNYFEIHSKTLGKGAFSSAGMEKVQNTRIFADVDKTETVFLQIDNLFFEHKEMFNTPFIRDKTRAVLLMMKKYFQSFFSYSCAAFDIPEIRKMQDAQNDGTILKKDGTNFVNVLFSECTKDPQFKRKYLSVLRKLMPHCVDLVINEPSYGNNNLWLELVMDNDVKYTLSEVSDGTIHLLVLILILTLPQKDGMSMLAMDEPEMNLHPAWQKVIAKEILASRSVRQSFISTHSSDFLDEFTEGFLSGDVCVFVFDGFHEQTIRKLESSKLRNDLREWTLGDLYRVGDPVIGGWPQ